MQRNKNHNDIFASMLIGIILLLSSTRVAADDVTATVDRVLLSPEESALLSVIVPGGDAQVDIAVITDFKVIPQGTSSSIQVINGQVSKEARYNYALLPLKEGELTIPALTVHLDGKTYQTDPIRITVSRTKETDPGGRPLFVEAQVSEASPFVGQQIIYTFLLYNSGRIANAGLQPPDFDGFTSQEIKRKEPYRKVVNGREYMVTEVSYILVPLKPGRMEIPPTVLTCDLVKQRPRSTRRPPFDSFFDDSFFGGGTQLESRIFKTRPLKVTVRALPPEKEATSFSGLVGRFDLQVQLSPNKLKAGDSATLTITVTGQGNIMDAEMPNIKLPDGFKVYPDKPQDEVVGGPNGYSGKKIFRSALVAVAPGIYRIPPIGLRYFDISTGEYRSLESKSLSLEVVPADKKEELEVYGPMQPSPSERIRKKKVEFSERDILPVKDGLDAIENQADFSPFLFFILILIPAFLSIGGLLLLGVVRRDKKPSEIMVAKARKALKKAHRKDIPHVECLSFLHKALMAAVFAKAGMQGEAATYAEAAEILKQAALPGETIEQTIAMLMRIDSERYGGIAEKDWNRDRLYEQTQALVRRLIP